MKKLASAVAVAALIIFAAQAIYYKHQARPAGPALSATDRQTLRDAPNSDLNGDVRDILSNLNQESSGVPAVPGAAVAQPEPAPAAGTAQPGLAQQDTQDCSLATFLYGGPLESQPATLHDYQTKRVCESYGGKNYCHDQVRDMSANAVIALTGTRTTLPWERDVFKVCLQRGLLRGERVKVHTIVASHHYKMLRKPSAGGYRIEALAQGKLRTNPDPAGISAVSFGNDAANGLVLTLTDKWASYYQGDKTVVKVALKMVKPFAFDPVAFEQELVLPPQDSYVIRFADYAAQFKKPLEHGMEYFVEWGFKREGKVSNGDYQKSGATMRAMYP